MSSQVFSYEFYEFFLVNVFIEHAAADLENSKHIVVVYLRNVFRTLFSQIVLNTPMNLLLSLSKFCNPGRKFQGWPGSTA